MANQKAELHDIPLKTLDVCLNKYDHDIKPYEGFRKNNSPFYGNLLSPFYKKDFKSLGKKSYVTKDGLMYCLKDGVLTLVDNTGADNEYALNPSGARFMKKETLDSQNALYCIILGAMNFNSTEYFLCSSNQGAIAILDSNWQVAKIVSAAPLYNGSKVHFIETIGNSYCFMFENKLVAGSLTGGSPNIQDFSQWYNRDVVYTCSKLSDAFLVYGYFESNTSYVRYVPTSDYSFNVVYNITFTSSTLGTWSDVPSGDLIYGFMRIVNNKVCRAPSPLIKQSGSYKYGFFTGNITGVTYSGGSYYLQVTLDEGNMLRCPDSDTMDLLSGSTAKLVFDNYTFRATLALDFTANYNQYKRRVRYSSKYRRPTTSSLNVTQNIDDGFETRQDSLSFEKINSYTNHNFSSSSISTFVNSTIYMTPGCSIFDVDTEKGMVYCGVSVDDNGYRRGGFYTNIGDRVRVLYHSDLIRGISISTDDYHVGTMLCVMDDIDSSFPIAHWTVNGETFVYYKDSNSWNKIKISADTDLSELSLLNERYLLINTEEYFNCFDTVEKRWEHFASDYNDRALPHYKYFHTEAYNKHSWSDFKASLDKYNIVDAQGSNYTALRTPFISTLYPQQTGYFDFSYWDTKYGSYEPVSGVHVSINARGVCLDGICTEGRNTVDLYIALLSAGTVDYYASVTGNLEPNMITPIGVSEHFYYKDVLIGTIYTSDRLVIPSIFAKFIQGLVNQCIIVDNDTSYIQVFSESKNPVFAMSADSAFEGSSNVFIVQSQSFIIINDCIYRYISGKPAESVVKIGSMKLIGYNPYMAIFWSPTNKTFYKFTGDVILDPLIQADEIQSILDSSYNPSTLSIYVVTDKYALLMAPDFLVKYVKESPERVFPLNNGCALVSDSSTVFLSYNKRDDFEVEPIELETECYGLGNSIKSVNDCVYIRLFDEDMKEGIVKVSSETLNETSKVADEKVFNITKDKWDKNSKTIFLRYQPKFQAATGFSVKIKSPFAIASLQISATPETVQNSKYNV